LLQILLAMAGKVLVRAGVSEPYLQMYVDALDQEQKLFANKNALPKYFLDHFDRAMKTSVGPFKFHKGKIQFGERMLGLDDVGTGLETVAVDESKYNEELSKLNTDLAAANTEFAKKNAHERANKFLDTVDKDISVSTMLLEDDHAADDHDTCTRLFDVSRECAQKTKDEKVIKEKEAKVAKELAQKKAAWEEKNQKEKKEKERYKKAREAAEQSAKNEVRQKENAARAARDERNRKANEGNNKASDRIQGEIREKSMIPTCKGKFCFHKGNVRRDQPPGQWVPDAIENWHIKRQIGIKALATVNQLQSCCGNRNCGTSEVGIGDWDVCALKDGELNGNSHSHPGSLSQHQKEGWDCYITTC